MQKMKTNILILLCVVGSMQSVVLYAQTNNYYFGSGNNCGVNVSSSSVESSYDDMNTLTGLHPKEASRFLAQAGFGGSYSDIQHLMQIGIDAWLIEQFTSINETYLNKYNSTYTAAEAIIDPNNTSTTFDKYRHYATFSFYEKVLEDDDVLRNKAAFALSQIFVVSTNGDVLGVRGRAGADYYDIFYQNAFLNFRNILEKVTLHTIMGHYLSHFQNRKEETDANGITTYPDENYAREIMQLFTIGLYELNNDGTYKLDTNGERIPTYDIDDIKELAKVFTGLAGSQWIGGGTIDVNINANFYNDLSQIDMAHPMAMFEAFHDIGPKVMIDGTTLPANQTGMQDIDGALDILFYHDNVGPFIALRLIQQMVKSNPTPAYINRVANAFNDNGNGVRGDMEAVFRAILTDVEARTCSCISNSQPGKLKQPLERIIHLLRAFEVSSPSGKLWLRDAPLYARGLGQSFMGAPSVFNYFTPFYAEPSIVAPANMVSPEFQILNAVSAINYLNMIENSIIGIEAFQNQTATDGSLDPKLQTILMMLLFLILVWLLAYLMIMEQEYLIGVS